MTLDLPAPRVLVVDDETGNVKLLDKVLRRAGYTDVIGITDPRGALDVVRSSRPDIILLDLAMPFMDGFEVMALVRSLPEDAGGPIPIVVLTADITSETKRKALTSGANDFLTKPFENDEVVARVANLLETRRLHLVLARHNEHLEEEVERRIEELKETEGRLFQSQKMDAVGQLAGGIAHDFNNLLAVIINYAILLLEDMDPNDPLREEVSEIQRAGESAAKLTRQLLAFSRKEAINAVVLDVNEVIRDTQKLLQRTIGENIDLVVDLAGDLARTKLDPGQLEQVLLNLAINARDAMAGGGTLSIRSFDATMDAAFCSQHPGAYPGDYVCVEVCDTGTGMTEEVRARLFEPFFTTKQRGVGTGLGLATVYGVVKQADGYIDVGSIVGEGSSFTVYLRTTMEQADEISPSSDRPEAKNGNKTVLVAEDAEGVRRIVDRLLSRNGFEVLSAANGDKAVSLAESHEGPIHVLLTDIIMPGMSGKDLARTFRDLYPHSAVIFMSGYTEDVIDPHDLLDGVTLLRKPFKESELIDAVRGALGAVRV